MKSIQLLCLSELANNKLLHYTFLLILMSEITIERSQGQLVGQYLFILEVTSWDVNPF